MFAGDTLLVVYHAAQNIQSVFNDRHALARSIMHRPLLNIRLDPTGENLSGGPPISLLKLP